MVKQVEICCGSYYDALQAEAGGAKRIELNSALHMGGLTPSAGTMRLVKQHTNLEVMAMVRPRGAGFCYDEADLETMRLDCKIMMKEGADGIVFGCLDAQGDIDVEITRRFVEMIQAEGKQVVFHRAFDCVKDPYVAIETLISLGIDRVLTSGTFVNVSEGKDVLKKLQETYGDKIEILAGCGVNVQNARELMAYTGISQIHSSCKSWKKDSTTCGERVSYAYADGEHCACYDVVDAKRVRELINSIQ